jgi:hypothetical protein
MAAFRFFFTFESSKPFSVNIKDALLEEHSKRQRDKIVKHIGENKDRFAELMHLFFKGEYRITQRAAWSVSYCVKAHPELIKPYFSKLLNNLAKKGLHGSVIRNTVRLLQHVEVPKRYQGKLMNICFNFIQSHNAEVAIKAFSLTVLHNLSKHYPEILPELKLVIEERWEHETAAFRTRARNIVNGKL